PSPPTALRSSHDGVVIATRVISRTDAPAGRIYWVHPDPEWRLPYDAPLLGVNPDLPLLIESVEYSLAAFQAGQLLLIRERLSTVRENDFYGPRVLGFLVNPNDAANLNILPPPPSALLITHVRPFEQ